MATPTSGSDCSLWVTPIAQDDNKSLEAHLAMRTRMGERDGTGAKRASVSSLSVQARSWATSAWVTPSVQAGGQSLPDDAVWKGTTAYAQDGRKLQTGTQSQAKLWATPVAFHGEKGGPNQSRGGDLSLPGQAVHFASPAPDWVALASSMTFENFSDETLSSLGLAIKRSSPTRPPGRPSSKNAPASSPPLMESSIPTSSTP